LIPNPIRKVLLTLAARQVRALLMGGQACVFYGAVEFSRDADILILAETANLDRLALALRDLAASCIAVPPFQSDYLERGHGVHFRCAHPDAAQMRIDVMARLRGVEPFPVVWERRATIADRDETVYELLSLPDLVLSKKTQRDKDWPVIRRLLEADYQARHAHADETALHFWLREMRTPELLLDLASQQAVLARDLARARPLLTAALAGNFAGVAEGLQAEENHERELDREYWRPLKMELIALRADLARSKSPPA